MDCVRFTYFGKVRGQGRHRFDSRSMRAYESKADRNTKKEILKQYVDQTGGKMLSGELSIEIDVYRELPRSFPRRIFSEPDTHKPDVDNIAKIFADALNGTAYKDDKQITSMRVTKHPRKRRGEHAVIEIREIEREEILSKHQGNAVWTYPGADRCKLHRTCRVHDFRRRN